MVADQGYSIYEVLSSNTAAVWLVIVESDDTRSNRI